MARSILVTEVFIKATRARIGTGDDSAALTLMSTDIERIKLGFFSLHDIWASTIQAALASWMLYNRLGVVFVVPMVVVAVCFVGLTVLIRFTGDSQRAWMSGVQKRVGLTSTVIASMKNLKISGLSTAVGDFVQNLRVEELAAGVRFRRIVLIAALCGYTPLMISPPLTFAFARQTLDASRMFTSLSFLTLLTQPLFQIFQTIPLLVSGLACLGRIQAFLECETREDFRHVLADMRRNNAEKARPDDDDDSSEDTGLESSLVIEGGKCGWEADKFVLQNVNTRVPKSSLTMVVGPVGSGKSTLCKTLLGEIPFFSEGRATLGTRFRHVGFCDQVAFLSNGTIRDNIVGFSPFDRQRYSEVIQATALALDLATLPQGDQTNVGSDGITLSGGQKQRVSLARALYLQTDLLVLDDVFSGLDADTEDQVFQRVFGPDGLLRRRRCTVVLCTHSVRHMPAADHIIALGNSTIIEQGTFDELMTREGYVQGVGLTASSSSSRTLSEKRFSKHKSQEEQSNGKLLHTTTTEASPTAQDVDESRKIGDKIVYKHYFKSMGLFLAASSMIFGALLGFFTNFSTVCKFPPTTTDVSNKYDADMIPLCI